LTEDSRGARETGSLTAEEFRQLCEFLYRRTGIVFAESKRYFVERRLGERMSATGCHAFTDYFARVRTQTAEVESLINAFTVNETYFFREDHQLRCLTSSLLDEVVRGKPPGAPVRIWSIPCATGEEPYSVAIWLLEHWPRVDEFDVEIVGSDIDTRVLNAARAGIYGERALMRVSRDLVARYFETVGPGRYRIIKDLRSSVRFDPINLIDAAAMALQGRFDIVFCRNVLIYFDDASRRVAAENIYESLLPGGFVCLGHTESMSRISPLFEVSRFSDAIVYRRPGGVRNA
jgi:chemotaxis protein methyltransferase CheR